MKIKFFYAIVLSTVGQFSVYAAISNDIGDLSQFDNVPVVSLWRGVHFLPEYFPDDLSRQQLIDTRINALPLYSTAAYKNANVDFNAILTEQGHKGMDNVVDKLREIFRGFNNTGPITINKQKFSTYRDAFQQIYANSTDFISKIGKPNSQNKYKSILVGLPEGNPLLSFSKHVKHPALYAYGMKDYGSYNSLVPAYSNTGKPNNPILGYLQCCLLTDKEAKISLPYDVQLNHQAGYIKVKTHSSCNILAESEVSLVGKVSRGLAVFSTPLEVPDFSGSYNHTMKIRFGLTKRRFDKAKEIITDIQTLKADKDKKISDVIKKVIEGKQTNDLAHTHTLTYKLPKLIEEAFESQGIEYQKGALNINGRVGALIK